MVNPIRPASPGLLSFALGIAGLPAGGLVGMFGFMAIDPLIHAPGGEVRDAIGEYAAPYGLMGSVLGLILGAWGGLHLGRRWVRRQGSAPGESSSGEVRA